MVKNGCLLFAIDGLDGSGKSTQIKLLSEYLKKTGLKVSVLQHSGGSEIGMLLRTVSRSNTPRNTEVDLHISLAMAYALTETLDVQKNEFNVILVDRSQLSMYAYNVVAGKLKDKKLGDKSLIELSKLYNLNAILYLETDDSTNTNRLGQRGKKADYFENRTEFNPAVLKNGYQKGIQLMKQLYPKTKIIRIDANGSIDDVHNKIVETVKKML